MTLNQFLTALEEYLLSDEPEWEFSGWIEDTLYDNFEQFEQEDKTLAEQLHENLYDICGITERDQRWPVFRVELAKEVDRLRQLSERAA